MPIPRFFYTYTQVFLYLGISVPRYFYTQVFQYLGISIPRYFCTYLLESSPHSGLAQTRAYNLSIWSHFFEKLSTTFRSLSHTLSTPSPLCSYENMQRETFLRNSKLFSSVLHSNTYYYYLMTEERSIGQSTNMFKGENSCLGKGIDVFLLNKVARSNRLQILSQNNLFLSAT